MEHEPSEFSCNHDADVMCTDSFFDKTLSAHLCRVRLHQLMDGKRHWVFAVTPECLPFLLRLKQLCAERDIDDVNVLHLNSLPMAPTLVCIPRDTLALDDLSDLVDVSAASREAYERKDYIAITRLNTDVVNQALSNWLYLDHLVK
jgi:hypothetical protein